MGNNGILMYDTKDTDSYEYKMQELIKKDKVEFENTPLEERIPFITFISPEGDGFYSMIIQVPCVWVDNDKNKLLEYIDMDITKKLIAERVEDEAARLELTIGKLVSRMGVASIARYLDITDFFQDLGVIPSDGIRKTDSMQRTIFKEVSELVGLYYLLDSFEKNNGRLLSSIIRISDIIRDSDLHITKLDDRTNNKVRMIHKGFAVSIRLSIASFCEDVMEARGALTEAVRNSENAFINSLFDNEEEEKHG